MLLRNSFALVPIVAVAFVGLASAQSPTSETNRRLRDALEQYPQADADRDGVLTLKEARAYQRGLNQRSSNNNRNAESQETVPPTHADIKYGPYKRNNLDLWLVDSSTPTPLLICIHGGGFSGGDKKKYHSSVELISRMHQAGISVASINYRLTEKGRNPYPIPMHDGARAVQFLRHHAETYNLDKSRFGATGGSAGGCMLMWLGFHEDMADPNSDDPIETQSTRLIALAPVGGQSCLHLPTLLEWFGVKSLQEHGGGRPLFGLPLEGELVITPQLDAQSRDASPITHLTQDDPACFMNFGRNVPIDEQSAPGTWVHHPIMGFKLQEAMSDIGLECHVNYRGGPAVEGYQDQIDFLIRKLKQGTNQNAE